MIWRNASRLIAALGCLGGCLGLIAGVAEAQTPKRGGTAVFVVTQDPPTLNPAVSANPPDREVGCILYHGLVQIGMDYKILPWLAKSWTVSPDGMTYTFELAKAEWQDGQPFVADDVKYSLIEVNTKYSSIFGPAGKAIDTIEAPAPDKVVIKLKQPFGPFLLSLACPQGGSIMPAHLFRGTDPMTNPATSTAPVGTGPFKLAEWKRGDYLRLAKNPKFFIAGRPYLDDIVVKVIPQSAARVQALQAGEVDLVQLFPPSDQDRVRANPNLRIQQSDVAPGMTYAFLNTSRKPLDDRRVRQALFMAVDRDYLIKNAFFNHGSVGVMPFTTEIAWAVNPAIDYRTMYPYDPAKANALLDEAGVKRGADGKRFAVRLAIYSNSYPEFQQVSVALKSMWQAVGVDVTVESLEDATLIKKVYVDRDFDITLNSYTSLADPALGIARAFITSSIGKAGGNPGGYSNPEVDALFDKGEHGITTDARAPYYHQVQAILAKDVPNLTLRQYINIDATTARLKGLWGVVQGNGDWTNAWLDQ